MAITYSIEQQSRIVILTVTGDSSFPEWEDAMRRVLADPEYVRGFNFLTDRREQSNQPEPESPLWVLRFLVGHTPEMGRYRWAAVSNTEASYGAVRMFSILAEEVDIQIEAFKDYEKARRWLLGGEADAD